MLWTGVLLACALCCAAASAVVAARGPGPTRTVAAGMAGAAVWSAAAAVLTTPVGPTEVVVLRLLTTSGALVLASCAYWLSRAAQDPHRRPTRTDLVVLVGTSVTVMAALVTNPWHQLAYVDEATAAPPGVRWGEGPLYGLLVAVIAVPALLAVVHFVRGLLRSPAHYRPHVRVLLLTWAVVSASVAASLVLSGRPHPAGPPPHQDVVPVGLAVTAVAIVHGVLRRQLLAVVPLARAQVVEELPDAVLVLDARGRVVDVNASGRGLLERLLAAGARLPGDALGGPLRELLPFLPPDLALAERAAAVDASPLPGLHLGVRTSPIRDHGGAVVGRAVVLRDVTEVVERRLVAERTSARLAEEAAHDPLTGLLNRRGLRATADGLAVGAPLAVVIVDLDHFKAVNDTHGHDAGDAVLVILAGVLRDAVAPHRSRRAAAARLGGEEFVLLLPDLGADAAVQVAEGVLAALRASTTPLPDGRGEVRVTASAGVSVGASLSAGLAEADAALYAAKRSGRDRAVLARPRASAARA